jgi:hypothetical protein
LLAPFSKIIEKKKNYTLQGKYFNTISFSCRGSMRQDFDGVDFVMDAIFGSSALLGIGWLVSITI